MCHAIGLKAALLHHVRHGRCITSISQQIPLKLLVRGLQFPSESLSLLRSLWIHLTSRFGIYLNTRLLREISHHVDKKLPSLLLQKLEYVASGTATKALEVTAIRTNIK
jgi:hypothetical protein